MKGFTTSLPSKNGGEKMSKLLVIEKRQTLKENLIKQNIKGFIYNEDVSSLFFEGTKELKLFRILRSDYPKFHNAYSLQVKVGHDRKVIVPILRKWAKFKLVEVIEDIRSRKKWRINENFLVLRKSLNS